MFPLASIDQTVINSSLFVSSLQYYWHYWRMCLPSFWYPAILTDFLSLDVPLLFKRLEHGAGPVLQSVKCLIMMTFIVLVNELCLLSFFLLDTGFTARCFLRLPLLDSQVPNGLLPHISYQSSPVNRFLKDFTHILQDIRQIKSGWVLGLVWVKGCDSHKLCEGPLGVCCLPWWPVNGRVCVCWPCPTPA